MRAFPGDVEAEFPRPSSAPNPSHLTLPVGDSAAVHRSLAELRPPVHNIGDLLEHVPFRHEDFRDSARLADVKPGEEATVVVTIDRVRLRPTRRRNLAIVEARVHDDSGSAMLVWFNQRYLLKSLEPGMRISVRGERRQTIDAEITVKSHEPASGDSEGLHTSGLVPVYPASEKLTSRRLRTLVDTELHHAGDRPDAVPAAILARRRLPLRRDALVACHQPRTPSEHARGRRRLAYDELLLLQLGLLEQRRAVERDARAPQIDPHGALVAQFLEQLPFALTSAQQRVVAEIDADLARPVPMRRLLQGDVGSGKTAVAVYALLRAIGAGLQGALMAPTETLASQHLVNVTEMVENLNVRVIGLAQGMPAGERRAALQVISSGEPAIVVGTHALIQDAVTFGSLGVAVVDEQHRFGVQQRGALERKSDLGTSPHVLHMTATPIPRTLAMTVFGDLDVSVLDELPPGRTPVITRLVPGARRSEVFARMRRLLDEGRQAYVVCPLVSESEVREAAAAETETLALSSGELRGYRVECLHGQLPVAERRVIMERFRRGEIDVLVATTVIEVGVDVPNAVVMVIEGADLFGLAQLHQLRGRVGRGGHESYCMLIADPTTDDARERLDAMVRTTDGFALAEVDLNLRGEGSVLALRQSGVPDLRHARLRRHRRLAVEARVDARRLLDDGTDAATAALLADERHRIFGEDQDWVAEA